MSFRSWLAVSAAIVSSSVMFASRPVLAGSVATFSDRAAFEGALGGARTVDDFGTTESYGISTGTLNATTSSAVAFGAPIVPGRVRPGVTYSTPVDTGLFFNLDVGGGFSGAFLDGMPGTLTATFDSPVRGFGFETRRVMGTELEVIINFTSGTPYIGLFAIPGAASNDFFGFLSSARDIASMTLFSTNGMRLSFAVDNFTFGTGLDGGSAVVPLPAPALLLGVGLLALGAAARRRRPG
ncbi:MAG: hypothetical protein ACK515_14175 [bacterium]|nr:hypothetical protein [Betaproteobacteria bacterium]